MIDFKKMDEKDIVFINKPLTYLEEKEFSDYLKTRSNKIMLPKISKKSKILQTK